MPVANLYATVEDLSQRAPAIIVKDEAGEITDESRTAGESLLEAISRAIDSKTRRTPGAFSPSPNEPTAHVVYGNNKSCLEIPAHIKGTVNTTVTTIAGVSAPHCVEHRGLLCIVDTSGVMLRNARWREGVPYTITARWGYQGVPADIREACLVWAAIRARLNAGDMSGAVTTITRDGSTLMRDDVPPSVKDLIAPYILPERETEDDGAGLVEMGDIKSSDDHPFDPNKRYW
jgi:hypothetical protein